MSLSRPLRQPLALADVTDLPGSPGAQLSAAARDALDALEEACQLQTGLIELWESLAPAGAAIDAALAQIVRLEAQAIESAELLPAASAARVREAARRLLAPSHLLQIERAFAAAEASAAGTPLAC